MQEFACEARCELLEWSGNRNLCWMNHEKILSVDNGEESLPCTSGREDYYANFTAADVTGMAGTKVEIGIIRKLA